MSQSHDGIAATTSELPRLLDVSFCSKLRSTQEGVL
jgi:hypothetical protein